MNRILVVEDDAQVRSVVCDLLGAAGFLTTAATDGIEALDQLRKEQFDLVLLDIWMPRMNGLGVLEQVRTLSSPPKIIVMTGDDAPETVLGAARRQAYRYVTKPLDPKGLVELVGSALAEPAALEPIEVVSARPNWVELLVPCTLEAAERIQGFLELLKADLPGDVRESLGKAFRELLLNAIEWGGRLDPSRKVRISCLRTSRMLMYRIADPGPGFRFEDLAHAALNNPPEKPADHERVREEKGMRPGGFGILMARAMVDELVYNEAHNDVVLIKYLD